MVNIFILITTQKVKNVILIVGSYYAIDKDYDQFRQQVNVKMINLNLIFFFEDAIALFVQYFYVEKYIQGLNVISLANATVMLILSMYGCFRCIWLLRWARHNSSSYAKLFKTMIQPWECYNVGCYTLNRYQLDVICLVYY